ncbi:hypothetical protein TCAL_13132 [Tigriopus californicus]|uniref:Etoposide-induced protein 2.4 homolog n=1 Tax=Tigriopus californicus TaxID=6832 RepID=A0A553NE15_TIGCA|nr:etoposide-induced protein 2.4 homolog [Tigriopus californicus]TRY63687.1 hypothetical protein TCAL_13132 [Tigriopus californicus]|eukprot:TCALIF_13132-PA protein Name:"Similar to EI24 Etoposide-induced protein 2.4 homolog (Homo sapiens)" AED:0.06 eAED:0.06 QI:0/-1/0/1/-1/1/1/0/414
MSVRAGHLSQPAPGSVRGMPLVRPSQTSQAFTSPSRGVSLSSMGQMVGSFLRGFVHSLKGALHIFLLDQNRLHLKQERQIRPDIHRERLLNRNSPVRDHELFAKKRALERREKLLNPPCSSSAPAGGASLSGLDPSRSPSHLTAHEPSLLHRTLKCCLFNGGFFWLSILIFEQLVLPVITWLALSLGEIPADSWAHWMQPVLSLIFSTFWVLPLFLLSKVVNAIWFQDIANSAFKFSQGRPQMMSSLSVMVADTIYSLAVETVFLAQTALVSLVPIIMIGRTLALVHLCLLNALYCFEYKWFNQGLELHRRLHFVEQDWPYFLGFGLPLALITSAPSSLVVRGCVFAMIFPLFIVSANQAIVIAPQFDMPLRIFRPTMTISNYLFSRTLPAQQQPTKNPSLSRSSGDLLGPRLR